MGTGTVGGNARGLTAIKADAEVATWCETVQIAQSAPRAVSPCQKLPLRRNSREDIMKSRLLAMFAVLGLLVGTVAAVTPVHAAGFTGFVHSDNNGDNGNQ
jgi:hypothetical protein